MQCVTGLVKVKTLTLHCEVASWNAGAKNMCGRIFVSMNHSPALNEGFPSFHRTSLPTLIMRRANRI
jgi:hypothetical protein